MTALELISLIYQVLFVGLFVAVLRHAMRERSRANFDVVLLFGAIAGVVALSQVSRWLGFNGHPVLNSIIIALLALVPFAMLRLVDDFRGTPGWVQAAGFGGFLLIALLGFVVLEPMRPLVQIAAIAFFLVTGGYAAIAFADESRRSHGITRRRMTAVAVGAVVFIAALVLVFLNGLLPQPLEPLTIAMQVAALTAVVAFFLGFAPPAWIRRSWREPELRRFLEQSIHLAGMTDEREALAALDRTTANALGATGASIGLADDERGIIRYVMPSTGEWVEYPQDALLAGRAYRQQRRVFARDATHADPENAALYEAAQAISVLAAPISTDTRRLGVLTVFAARPPLFIEDDIWLLGLVADQIALLLEARELTEHASELRAREEAARLKEEFLSAAAHDLRTPLTVVLGQAELLERRLRRNPEAPVDLVGVERMTREARRLSDLVTELLDAQRLEQGAAIMERVPTDLRGIVETAAARYAEGGVTVSGLRDLPPLLAAVDRPRIEQVLDNLIENALKYTPHDEPPEVEVSADGHAASISVVDHGIGIPEADRPRIFQRFFRGSNAQSITDTGLGLGLYICRRIVEEHGGTIGFRPTPGGGTTFSFSLPLVSGEPDAEPAAEEASVDWRAGGAEVKVVADA